MSWSRHGVNWTLSLRIGHCSLKHLSLSARLSVSMSAKIQSVGTLWSVLATTQHQMLRYGLVWPTFEVKVHVWSGLAWSGSACQSKSVPAAFLQVLPSSAPKGSPLPLSPVRSLWPGHFRSAAKNLPNPRASKESTIQNTNNTPSSCPLRRLIYRPPRTRFFPHFSRIILF